LSIIQEHANDFLDAFAICCIEGSGVIRFRGILDLGAIVGMLPCVGGMFGSLGVRVAEPQKSTFNVSGHGNVNGAFGIIPL